MRPARLLLSLVILLVGVGLYLGFRDRGEVGDGIARGPAIEAPPAASEEGPDLRSSDPTGGDVQRAEVGDSVVTEGAGASASPLETTHLVGRVVDPSGAPLAGCEVLFLAGGSWLASMQESLEFPLDHAPRATSDAEGGFAFQGIAPGNDNALLVRHPELRPELVRGVVVQAFDRSTEPPVVLRQGKTVRGTVSNVAGQPIEGAQLHLDESWSPTGPRPSLDRLSTTTDELGHFQIRGVPDGKRCLTVTAEGFGTLTRIQSLVINDKTGDTHLVDFQLRGAVELRGRVLDLAGEPVAGAQLLAVDRAAHRDVAHGGATSAADGSWAIDDLAPGTYELRVTAEGFEDFVQSAVEVPRTPWSLLLQAKKRVEGYVVNAESGEGLERFALRLRRLEEDIGATRPVGPLVDRVGGPRGSFTIPVASEFGPWVVEARAAGFAPSYSAPFDGSIEGNITGIRVEMSRGGELRGRLVDAGGRPVAGRVICRGADWSDDALTAVLGAAGEGEATTRHLRCDADGLFVLANLRPGRYQLFASGPGLPERRVPGLEVVEGASLDLQDVVLPPGGALRGTIYDAESAPVVGAMVFLQPADRHSGLALRRVKTGLGGGWRLGEVSAGSYLLSARPPGADLGAFTLWPDRGGEELTLLAGVEDVRDLHLADWRAPEASKAPPLPPSGEVRGALLRPGGEPVVGAPLELRPAGMALDTPQLAKTGPDGAFVFPAIPPGDYLLLPSGHEASGVEVTVRAERTTEQDLELSE